MWGIEGIDRSTTTAESLVSGDLGSVIYDEKFNFESSRQVFQSTLFSCCQMAHTCLFL
jgi:hypothetical protein